MAAGGLTCPERSPEILSVAPALPFNSTQISSTWSVIVSGQPSLANTIYRTKFYPELGDFRGNDCARGDDTNVYRCLGVDVNVNGA